MTHAESTEHKADIHYVYHIEDARWEARILINEIAMESDDAAHMMRLMRAIKAMLAAELPKTSVHAYHGHDEI